MKKINGIVNILKIVVKYGAYFAVGMKVIQFAIDEFTNLEIEKTVEKDAE